MAPTRYSYACLVVLVIILIAWAAGRGRPAAVVAAGLGVVVLAAVRAQVVHGAAVRAQVVHGAAVRAQVVHGAAKKKRALFGWLRTPAGKTAYKRVRKFLRGFDRQAVAIIARGGGDAATLSALRTAWAQFSHECQKPSYGRERSRVKAISRLLDPVRQGARDSAAYRYLDIGSSEGQITVAMADELGLPKSGVAATDIVPQAASARFEFVLTDGRSLPFDDSSFDLITMFMSAHHFEDVDRMFAEAARVSKPAAYLIMREHGKVGRASRAYYDFVHAFYEVVAGDEASPEEFAKRYADGDVAHYRTLAEWTTIAEKVGYAWRDGDDAPRADKFDTVHALFQMVGRLPLRR